MLENFLKELFPEYKVKREIELPVDDKVIYIVPYGTYYLQKILKVNDINKPLPAYYSYILMKMKPFIPTLEIFYMNPYYESELLDMIELDGMHQMIIKMTRIKEATYNRIPKQTSYGRFKTYFDVYEELERKSTLSQTFTFEFLNFMYLDILFDNKQNDWFRLVELSFSASGKLPLTIGIMLHLLQDTPYVIIDRKVDTITSLIIKKEID